MYNWKYILAEDGRTPIQEPDLEKWALWFEQANRRVALDKVGVMTISTVFLGLDQNMFSLHSDKPVLWETMIFGGTGELEYYQERYRSYEEAVQGHQRALTLVLEKQPKQ